MKIEIFGEIGNSFVSKIIQKETCHIIPKLPPRKIWSHVGLLVTSDEGSYIIESHFKTNGIVWKHDVSEDIEAYPARGLIDVDCVIYAVDALYYADIGYGTLDVYSLWKKNRWYMKPFNILKQDRGVHCAEFVDLVYDRIFSTHFGLDASWQVTPAHIQKYLMEVKQQ